MKIVGFEANDGARLGVVEGDNVIDLQSVDANVPADLGEGCAGAMATSNRSPISQRRRRPRRAARLPV